MLKTASTRFLPVLFALALPVAVFASSHKEAPAIAGMPRVDHTDLYAFRSPDAPNTVTIVASFNPIEEPAGGPNFGSFDDNALYEIHIDNNGDAKEDVTYQFRFRSGVKNGNTFLYNTGPILTLDSANLNVTQRYTVTRVTGDRRTGPGSALGEFQVAPANIGPKSTPDYPALANAAVGTLSANGGKVFAGPRADSFFVDLGSVFDLLTLRPIQQLQQVPPIGTAAPGINTLKGFNVETIAIQVPISALTNGAPPTDAAAANAVIGIWSTSSLSRVQIRNTSLGTLQQNIGGTTQVSRLGMPLVNEVVVPLAFKDYFNASEPRGDKPLFDTNATFRNRILDPEGTKLINALYGVTVPPAPRNDIVQVFLTGVPGLNMPPNVVPAEMLRLNVAIPVTATPNRLGVLAGDNQGFPNGRRLTDDVVDIELRVLAGVLVPGFNVSPNNALTDGVDAPAKPFLSTFPYLAVPYQGYDHSHHEAAAAP